MADSICLCLGSGMTKEGHICVFHLKEAYLNAMSHKDIEMAAVILKKQGQLK